MAKPTAEQVLDANKYLLSILTPGQTIYTILRHVSASGMTRRISVVVVGGGQPLDITSGVAMVCGSSLVLDNYRAFRVSGCGMDMGYHVVYELGRVLYPKGGPLPAGMHGRNGDASGIEKDGGYLFRHQWL